MPDPKMMRRVESSGARETEFEDDEEVVKASSTEQETEQEVMIRIAPPQYVKAEKEGKGGEWIKNRTVKALEGAKSFLSELAAIPLVIDKATDRAARVDRSVRDSATKAVSTLLPEINSEELIEDRMNSEFAPDSGANYRQSAMVDVSAIRRQLLEAEQRVKQAEQRVKRSKWFGVLFAGSAIAGFARYKEHRDQELQHSVELSEVRARQAGFDSGAQVARRSMREEMTRVRADADEVRNRSYEESARIHDPYRSVKDALRYGQYEQAARDFGLERIHDRVGLEPLLNVLHMDQIVVMILNGAPHLKDRFVSLFESELTDRRNQLLQMERQIRTPMRSSAWVRLRIRDLEFLVQQLRLPPSSYRTE